MSITGVLLEQLDEYFPDVLKSFQDLVATGCCELVAETYYHSLASLYSRNEFVEQVAMQKNYSSGFCLHTRVFQEYGTGI